MRWFAFAAAALAMLAAPAALADGPAPGNAQARFEADFLTDMIDHHAMAVDMAAMCIDKAVHDELRSLCQDISATQSQEIETMQSGLDEWYRIQHEPEHKPGGHKAMERMATMAGADFEVAFMETMVRHHEGAIREAGQCLRRAHHDPLLDLCGNIIAAQSQEIAAMERWLCEWHSRC